VRYKPLVRKLLHRLGYDISKFDKNQPGRNPFVDMGRFVPDSTSTTIFDVGANIGQSIELLRLHYPLARIHSFEPSPGVFRTLQARAESWSAVTAWNFAFGAAPGQAILNENDQSVMNSMLELGPRGWGEVTARTTVDLRTVDDFCREEKIDRIDILKSDTQGYDLEVFRGAEQMMRENRIHLILCEVNFAELYRNAAPFDAIFRFLVDHNFALVSFYTMYFCSNVAGWTDALFVNKLVLERSGNHQQLS
jgi:FkbM family methyltransferase